MHAFLCSILLLSFTQCCSGSNEETLGKVVFANVLFRHGYRTPIEAYPKDPYKNESLWPVPFGQLTNFGKHQQLMLGKWLRERYAHLLSAKYSLNDIYILSTDVDRTLMSAEANLAGMYPPSGDQVWDIKAWMPIPVHTVPERQDHVLAGKAYCERYTRELGKVRASPEMKEIDVNNAELYEYLSKMTGKRIHSLETVQYLYYTLYLEEQSGKVLPAWTSSIYPNKMKRLAERSFTIPAYNKILQRLQSGPLLKNMIEHMQLKSENALVPDRKVWLYSAHDYTIANMLMTLGVFEPHCPPFAATILIELRLNAQNHYVVTVSYKNSIREPILLTLPGCSAACPLSQFVRLTKDVIPNNWEKECSDGNPLTIAIANAVANIFATMLWFFILLCFSIVAFIFGCRLQSSFHRLAQQSTCNNVAEIKIHNPADREDQKINVRAKKINDILCNYN